MLLQTRCNATNLSSRLRSIGKRERSVSERLQATVPNVASRLRIGLAALFCAAFTIHVAADELACGSLANAFGPFDYRDHTKSKELHIVESYHFTPEVKSLQRGATSSNVMDDLNYTLRAFPNHWGALDTVSRFELQGGNLSAYYSVDCYFDRAIRLAPDDSNVRLLYGIYLMRRQRIEEAKSALEEAEKLAPDSVDIAYNLGLLYLRLGEPERAMDKARYAYERGYPLRGLRNALQKAGAWNP